MSCAYRWYVWAFLLFAEIMRKTGELFILRTNINSVGSVLDSPVGPLCLRSGAVGVDVRVSHVGSVTCLGGVLGTSSVATGLFLPATFPDRVLWTGYYTWNRAFLI